MNNTEITRLYLEYSLGSGKKSVFVEESLADFCSNASSIDQLLQEFFDWEGVRDLFIEACGRISICDFGESADVINGLMFLQELGAKALWKYHIELDENIENFVRSFDRLDLESERKRLHQEIRINKLGF
ncbi:hypothetical protein [Delftia acidovorans]|uniref:Uncharacterized protein n=1 Tax=Delftia acidovorans TaxID=80866 RepID=A0AAJ2R741_DELAC|nr:hypothetical protein [Delftia acidovorans]MDX4956362.1 hypothetical protein [Delftia acidovorans]